MMVNIMLFLAGGVVGYCLYSIRLRLFPIPSFVLHAIFDSLPRTVIVFNRAKRYHYVTPYLEKLFGVAVGRSIGKTHQDMVERGVRTPTPEGLEPSLGGKVFEEPLTPTLLDGAVVGWRKGIYWPIHNARGTVVASIFFAQRMEEAMQSMQDAHRKAMILACVQDAVIVVDLNHKITDWNQGAEDLYGYTMQEALGKTVRELVRPEITQEASVTSRIELHETGTWQGRSTRYTKSGRRMIVESRAALLRDYEGTVIGSIGLDREITAQADMESALRESEERYRSLFENAEEGIFRCTVTGQFIEVNPALIELLGYDDAQKVLATELPEYVRKVIENTSPKTLNLVGVDWQRNNGEPIVVDLSARLVVDDDGKPLYFDGTIIDVTERRQAEEALRQSEARFRALVENASDIFGVLDEQGRVVYISPSIQRVLGYDLTDYAGVSPLEVIHPDDIPAARDFVAQFAEGASSESKLAPLNARIRSRDGVWRDMEVAPNATPLNYPGLKGMVVIARDITERKQFSEKLRRQNEYLTALNETTLSLIERLDLEELLEDIINRAGTLLGAPQGYIFLLEPHNQAMKARVVVGLPKRFKGQRLKRGQGLSGRVWETGQAIVVNDSENWSPAQYDFKSRQFRASIAAPLKSGHLVVGVLGLAHTDPTLSFSPDEIQMFNRFAELASIALDNAQLYSAAQKELVDRTRAEDELRQLNMELEARVEQRTAELARRQAQLSSVLNAMGEGVFFSESFCIRYTNRALAEMTGYQIEELIGQPNTVFKSTHASPEDASRFSQDFVEPGQVWRGELTLRRKDGTEFPAGLTVARVTDADIDSLGAVIVVRDITREKELAEQKSSFLANASHELRTPLTNFKTRLYLLRKQPVRLEEHVAVLDRVTDRMTSLVEDLLDASRFERGVIPLQRDTVELQPLIEDVVLLQQPEAQRKNIHLTTHMPASPVEIFADANRIVQVMVNLVVNAINYTEDGGVVSVDLVAQEPNAIIHVQDTGMGIAPEHLPRVFEAFFRGSEGSVQGTGLGLFISKQIVDLHHGSLTVDSKRGKGTTFTVCLPLSDPDLNEGDRIMMFK